MVILVDTREQAPLEWKTDKTLEEVRVETLNVGDYAAEFKDGHKPPVVFERKSIGDLFGTLGKGNRRFKREIERAKEQGLQLVLAIEGTPADVMRGTPHSKMSGQQVMRTLMTMWVKHDVQPMFCASRKEMALVIRETYEAIGRAYLKEKKAKHGMERKREGAMDPVCEKRVS